MAPEDRLAMDRVTRRLWEMIPEGVRERELQIMSDEDATTMLELLAG